MTKSIEFPFMDGKKSVKVGDMIYVRSSQRRGGGWPAMVQKIGSKYISIGLNLTSRTNWQFEIETGREKSEMGCKDLIFTSEEAYNKWNADQNYIRSTEIRMRDIGLALTLDQAARINAILDEEKS